MSSRRNRLRAKPPSNGDPNSRLTRLRNVIPNVLLGAKDEANPAAVACFRRKEGHHPFLVSSEGRGMITAAMAQLAREHVGLTRPSGPASPRLTARPGTHQPLLRVRDRG